uniref:Retrovirus-related Pol polyprotein from transposon TNT 1-94 n=1 Tax=Tanacetum cinerariifolium TaxID=118510 RepID=A0A699JLQ3_TANCI|nr:retrovirus-related Pol polyprotein from transposon TNT 1-94 [Tanacetum cinerariifolium]
MTYLKHIVRFTHAQLKSRSFEEIQKLNTKEHKWVDAFVPIGSKEDEKRVGTRKKRAAGSSSKQKSPKKQKVNDQESIDCDKELRKCLKVVLDDDKAINYKTLDVKSPIIDCKSHKLGTMEGGDVHVYKLTRLDGSYRHFLTFSRMLKVFERQDVLDLHKIVMERFSANDPEGKVDEAFLVGYSVNSKAFRVFNSRTRIVQETLHVNFLENRPNVAEKAGEEIDQQYVIFPIWSSGSKNPQNNDEDAAFDGNEHDFDVKKPETEVILSLSSSAQSRKHDDKTKKEAKGKSPVESVTGYKDLNVEFEDCSDNRNNEVNDVGSIVPTVGQNSLNNINTFSAAGPSNAAVSPTYGKSLFIDAS